MKTILTFLIVLLGIGCTNNRKAQQIDSNHDLLSKNDTIVQNINESIFNKSMKYAINEYLNYIDSLNFVTPIENTISVFYFYSESGNDYFLISNEPYYTKKLIKGYTYIGKNIFVYYGKENIGKKYINADNLTPYCDTLPGFRSYEDVPGSFCDAFGIIFQIINPDSIMLVKKGML